MKGLKLFDVSPHLPERLRFLETLTNNLWWCWNEDAKELFRRIDYGLWHETLLNPILLLRLVSQERLHELAADEGFLSYFDQVKEHFEREVVQTLSASSSDSSAGNQVAYFSLEHGIHDTIRLYAGGLGVLAGDHLKAASDLGLPLVGVGLLYHQGYFQQLIDNHGWQQEHYESSDIQDLPIRPAECGEDHRQVIVSVPLPEGKLNAAVWRIDVGRVPLYVLSTDLDSNPEPLRKITRRLYSADPTVRLRQELLLGIGGMRALEALGYEPSVFHLNEGHAAFLNLARVSSLMKRPGVNRDTASEIVRRTTVFTTHTPVPAGNETFRTDLLRPHLQALSDELDLDPEMVIKLGQTEIERTRDELSMTVLGFRMAKYRNGVSRLHGEVARGMWSHLWPEHLVDQVPIDHITNGVHARSWIYRGLDRLYELYLGSAWYEDIHREPSKLSGIDRIPDEELWQSHERARARLIRNVRRHEEKTYRARSATHLEISRIRSVLNNRRLTIGFARRAATYKRLTLLLSEPERLRALLTDEERPVQLIFAGKAHPADQESKQLIQRLVQFSTEMKLQRHIVFLENYDMRIARRLVQGVDVWLNNPRRPQEASGTSGMKAALNGVLNASILDGWWDEAYTPEAGWTFGMKESTDDLVYQDTVDTQALYNLLEEEIVPRFYDRGESDLPRRWVKMMKASIKLALGGFTSRRMVDQYNSRFYEPASRSYRSLLAGEATRARELVAKRRRLRELWPDVCIHPPEVDTNLTDLHVGDRFTVTARLQLGPLEPREVTVQIYAGPLDSENRIWDVETDEMTLVGDGVDGLYQYRHTLQCSRAGRHGFTVRVVPHGTEWEHESPGFISWPSST
jgi:glycogen phosphorylase